MEANVNRHAKMSANSAVLFEQIWQEVARLHSQWEIFSQLYAESAEQVKFLDRMAPGFFGIVQEAMLNNIFLSFSRLTDNTKTGRKENLSFNRFIESIDSSKEPKFAEILRKALESLRTECKPFRDWRNRKIAHKDLSTALQYHPQPLPSINKEMIEKVLRLMRELLNTFQKHFEDAETAFEHVVSRGDGKTIIFYLQQAEKYEAQNKEELMRKYGIEPSSSS